MTVTAPFRAPLRSRGIALFVTAALASVLACDGTDANESAASPSANACATPPQLEKASYCEGCVFSPTAERSTCKAPRTINACCAWLAPPATPLARATGLARASSPDPTLDLACLDEPAAAETPQTVTLTGFVRLFSSGADSSGVRVEIFRENPDGTLGEAVGTPVVTVANDTTSTREDLLARCPDGGCMLRGYTYAGVPTATRLVVKTSNAGQGTSWATLYEYNVYFTNGEVVSDGISYDPTAIAAADLGTIAAAGGGFATRQERGLLVGEVHDCAGVRLVGASVDIDAAHDGDILYFGDDETNPLPDRSRYTGTSKLGMFGALNVAANVPVRVSAVGLHEGQTVLLGTHTVQVFKGAVTSIRLRGRRPWQR